MKVGEVHAHVEDRLKTSVSRDSVNSCLSVGARGTDARFERVRRGLYRIRE